VSVSAYLIVLSHWPHVATQVATQVAELVAELVFAMYTVSQKKRLNFKMV